MLHIAFVWSTLLNMFQHGPTMLHPFGHGLTLYLVIESSVQGPLGAAQHVHEARQVLLAEALGELARLDPEPVLVFSRVDLDRGEVRDQLVAAHALVSVAVEPRDHAVGLVPEAESHGVDDRLQRLAQLAVAVVVERQQVLGAVFHDPLEVRLVQVDDRRLEDRFVEKLR